MNWRAHGMRAWVIQRVSALYLAVYLIGILFWSLSETNINYELWYRMLSHPLIAISLVLFFLSLLLHAYVGMRDILIDYLSSLKVRFLVMSLVILSLLIEGIWLAMVIFSVVRV